MILAGDIGGTNARMALAEVREGRVKIVAGKDYPGREYHGLDSVIREFLAEHPDAKVEAACMAAAGPVRDGVINTTNLPWTVVAADIAQLLNLPEVHLINDLQANALGIAALDPEDFVILNAGTTGASGNQCVVSAGTGLGEAGIFWDGKHHHVFACEGGHTDFAARTEIEIELLRYLYLRFKDSSGRVSVERVLSGPGLVNIYQFFRDAQGLKEPGWLAQEISVSAAAAAISKAALAGTAEIAIRSLDMFVSLYGAEAGNMALKTLATGGVFIGGGIAPKISAKMTGGLFMDSFFAKGRMRPLLEAIPVRMITNDKTALLGSARFAALQSEMMD